MTAVVVITVHKQKYKLYDISISLVQVALLAFFFIKASKEKTITTVHILPDLPVPNFFVTHHAQCRPLMEISRIKTNLGKSAISDFVLQQWNNNQNTIGLGTLEYSQFASVTETLPQVASLVNLISFIFLYCILLVFCYFPLYISMQP